MLVRGGLGGYAGLRGATSGGTAYLTGTDSHLHQQHHQPQHQMQLYYPQHQAQSSAAAWYQMNATAAWFLFFNKF